MTFVSNFVEPHDPHQVCFRNFPEPEKFMPERWLRGKGRADIHPFASLPFSTGPRMCIGKRFADLEVHVLTIRLLQKFKLEWAGTEGPLEGTQRLVYYPNQDLKFRFLDLK